MQIVVKLSQEAAEAIRGVRPPSRAGERLRAVVAKLGLRLEPMHPGTSDLSMQQYFTLEVEDQEAASRAITTLQQDPTVEAAYVKPADEFP
jgi:hypothetical protein